MAGALQLDFDPWLRLGQLAVRWEAVALAAVIALSLLWFIVRLRSRQPGVGGEDLGFVVLAAIPGAVVGGRLVHGLAFADVYAADPAALFDLGRGTISLVGAVLGGCLSAAYVCRLLGDPVGRWVDAAAGPLLLAIGLGKLAMVLGGAGQGAPYDGAWTLVFAGDGWISADPGVPAHPSQIYEGALTLAGIPIIVWLGRRDVARRSGGLLLLAAICWWLGVRSLVALTWRDQPIVGSMGGEQLATIAGFVVMAAILVGRLRMGSRARDLRGMQPSEP